jgi:hypothetical protein
MIFQVPRQNVKGLDGSNSKEKEELNMTPQGGELQHPSFWQLVFLQSKVNGARYEGEQLTGHSWNWPKDTYLQRRLKQIRWNRFPETNRLN